MRDEHLALLRCPACTSCFNIHLCDESGEEATHLICSANGHSYPVRNGIPRFVPSTHYAESFGFQWNKFSRIQLDSYNKTNFSEERFNLITGWTESDLSGKLVLDAGCGAGRFSEVALKSRAKLFAFDLSEAVDAWNDNIVSAEAFCCQASVYELPFPQGAFDYVYCIGVVQHTPKPIATVRALCQMVKPGGQIALWIYERDWKSFIGTLGFKYALRPLLSRLPRSKQYLVCEAMVNLFFPIVLFLKPLGLFGKIMMRLLPVASSHIQTLPLSAEDFKAWVLLDTFDMYSPSYDQPQTYQAVTRLLTEENFVNIQRHPHGGIAVTAMRSS